MWQDLKNFVFNQQIFIVIFMVLIGAIFAQLIQIRHYLIIYNYKLIRQKNENKDINFNNTNVDVRA
jgi:hypothetical protein